MSVSVLTTSSNIPNLSVFPPVFPTSTPEPLVLLTPPRCLTANRTQQGVLLTWIPPANHTAPIQHYVMEFRLGERWEVLDDSIPAGETELLARDLIQVKHTEAGNQPPLLAEMHQDGGCAAMMNRLSQVRDTRKLERKEFHFKFSSNVLSLT